MQFYTDAAINKHVIFYDAECPLCNRAVRFVLSADKEKIFYFAPLNGETAKQKGIHLKRPDLDTLVLLQNYNMNNEKCLMEGRGALRIFWLLGGKYAWLGALSFLPPYFFDAIYRLVARYRYRLFAASSSPPKQEDRFLK